MLRLFRQCSECSESVQTFQTMFRVFRICSEFPVNVQTLFRMFRLFRQCSDSVQSMFRMFNQCSESVQTFSEFLSHKLVYSEFLNCSGSAKHTALRRKSKDWLPRNQKNASERSDMSTRGLLFQ
jgi:hypothetical protein